MRKILITAAASLALTTSALANHPMNPATTIALHSKPDSHAKVVGAPLNVNDAMIVILYSPDKQWAKVANKHNGQVGWISKADYLKAMQAKNKKDFQTIIVSTDYNNGKESKTIVAFRNGKPLSPKAAKTLYKKLKIQYKEQRRDFRHQQKMMQQMERDFFGNWPRPQFHLDPFLPGEAGPKTQSNQKPW